MWDTYDKSIKNGRQRGIDKMKICITSKGKDLTSEIDSRFGRCSYFLLIDPDTLDMEIIPNESSTAPGGAGIQAAQTVAHSKVSAVITGNIGPNAFQTLTAAGIKVLTGASGIVKEVVEQYKTGRFQNTEGPTVGSHFGMKSKTLPKRGDTL
jgi:predicted Fe-Mo cluster-binding NifX family protein